MKSMLLNLCVFTQNRCKEPTHTHFRNKSKDAERIKYLVKI